MSQFPFGDLDGEKVDAAVAKFTGETSIDRRFDEGDRVLVIAEALVGGPPGFKRTNGQLVRIEKFTVTHMVVVEDDVEKDLASRIDDTLEAAVERRTGVAKLPLDDPDTE
jgi:hypothetical protein